MSNARSVIVAVVASVLILACAPAQAAATGAKQRNYTQDYEAVWSATIGALQGRGDPVVYSEKTAGIITTDYKVEEDQDWRHKFNLSLVRNGEVTSVSVTCSVEKIHNSHAFRAGGWEDAKSDGNREALLLEAITRRLQPGGAAADTSDSNCRANFSIRGSVVRGTTYETFDEFQGLAQAAALDALLSAIPQQSLTLVTADKNTGVVSATGQSPRGKSYTLDFTVTSISGGARVSVVQKLHAGDRGHDDAVRDQLCKIVSAVSVAMPKPMTVSAGAGASPAGSTEERLRKLDDLLKKGLITKAEYDKKRTDILKDM
jgi:hypothetical protein